MTSSSSEMWSELDKTADWLRLASGLELRRFVGEGGLSASADVLSSPRRREQRTLVCGPWPGEDRAFGV